MKDLDINDVSTWPELVDHEPKASEIKPLELEDLPALNPAYANYAEELAAQDTGKYDEFATLPHINPELAGRVW